MIRKTILAIVVAGLAFTTGLRLTARMTSGDGQYVIPRAVVGGGGSMMEAPTRHLVPATVGQAVAQVSMADNGTSVTILVGGFHTMIPRGVTSAHRWYLY